MKKTKTLLLTTSLTAIIMASSLPLSVARAATSGLYFNPTSKSIKKNTSFVAELRIGDSATTGVRSNLTFDQTKLTVTEVSTVGSSFTNTTVAYDNSAGSISVDAKAGTGSGDRSIASLTFEATSTGDANLAFSGVNQTVSYFLFLPSWTNVATTNPTYTIYTSATPPPVTPSQPQKPTPSPSQPSTPPKTTTPAEKAKPIVKSDQKLALSSFSVSSITDTTAVISWATNTFVSSKLSYKPSASNIPAVTLLIAGDKTSNQRIATLTELLPNTSYRLELVIKANNGTTLSKQLFFQTKKSQEAAISPQNTNQTSAPGATTPTSTLRDTALLITGLLTTIIALGLVTYRNTHMPRSLSLLLSTIVNARPKPTGSYQATKTVKLLALTGLSSHALLAAGKAVVPNRLLMPSYVTATPEVSNAKSPARKRWAAPFKKRK